MARWGGEEFLILLPETNQESALILAEKVRELASHVPIITCSQTPQFTITSAVGELHAGEDFNRCLARIDQGLLEGKRTGKNRVVMV